MKKQDLQIGMRVAVKFGSGINWAYVLEIGTKWVWGHNNFRESQLNPRSVAIAATSYPYGQLEYRPDVVSLNQIIDTWDNHIATEEAKRERTRLVIEKERKRQDDFRARFDVLGLSEYAQLDANGWVKIPLAELERLLAKEGLH